MTVGEMFCITGTISLHILFIQAVENIIDQIHQYMNHGQLYKLWLKLFITDLDVDHTIFISADQRLISGMSMIKNHATQVNDIDIACHLFAFTDTYIISYLAALDQDQVSCQGNDTLWLAINKGSLSLRELQAILPKSNKA